ncbi:hypothetical protein [Paenibacillus campinasensis]|uniref:hypothetical protein n=3 Tax=Paenibacillus TaxID=44249 RepID=UPI0015CD3315|nr:hypothetical protein [Paenibacillus campinasensis]
MTKEYFEEMRKFSHNDDMRYKLLMRGVRQLYEERQKEKNPLGILRRRKRNRSVRVGKW